MRRALGHVTPEVEQLQVLVSGIHPVEHSAYGDEMRAQIVHVESLHGTGRGGNGHVPRCGCTRRPHQAGASSASRIPAKDLAVSRQFRNNETQLVGSDQIGRELRGCDRNPNVSEIRSLESVPIGAVPCVHSACQGGWGGLAHSGREDCIESARQIHLEPVPDAPLHGELYETHGNSIFSARSFFQVGAVQPARTNSYGLRLLIPLPSGPAFAVDAGQQKNRGNVLIPRPDERTPLAADPALRAIIARILDSFPAEAPNRPDIDPRAHNTTAPQSIDNETVGGRFDFPAGGTGRVALDYRFRRQAADAFQLVKGQNPDTTTGSHDARIT